MFDCSGTGKVLNAGKGAISILNAIPPYRFTLFDFVAFRVGSREKRKRPEGEEAGVTDLEASWNVAHGHSFARSLLS